MSFLSAKKSEFCRVCGESSSAGEWRLYFFHHSYSLNYFIFYKTLRMALRDSDMRGMQGKIIVRIKKKKNLYLNICINIRNFSCVISAVNFKSSSVQDRQAIV